MKALRVLLVLLSSSTLSVGGEQASENESLPWYVREPIRAGYQNFGPQDQHALRMKRAGLNTIVYAWNDWRGPADADKGDYSIRVMEEPMDVFMRWVRLADQHGLHVIAEIDNWSGDERKFFDPDRPVRRLMTADGVEGIGTCPREHSYWEYISRSIELMAEVRPKIDGAVIDTETYNAGMIYPGYGALEHRCCYCDSCFDAYAQVSKCEQASANVPPDERYGRLLSENRLSAYFAWLEDEMAGIGAALAKRIRADRPDFALGVLNLFGPGDWYGIGLARGMASEALPALVFSEQEYHTGYTEQSLRQLSALRNRDFPFRYVGGLMLSIMEAEEIQLVRAGDERVLIRDVRAGRDIAGLSDLYGDIDVRLRLIGRRWGQGAIWIRALGVE